MIQKDISYASRSKNKNLLDVYYTDNKASLPVIFFIHGGSWMNGSKDLYSKLAQNFLAGGFVVVLISYRLYPSTDVYGMVEDCRSAFEWCKNNIANYGGDARKIYLTGHSAGGHLAAVTGLLEDRPSEKIAGFILIDAFGLCANYFLSQHSALIPDFFAGVFGKEAKSWAKVSPDQLIKKGSPPFLFLTGGGTYPYIAYDNEKFIGLLTDLKIENRHVVIPSKSHMQMIFEFENKNADVYREISLWIKKRE
ncbi:MAG: alpha/beta hydrolase [Bacteroidetes bacterium]|nr:alpha/beta hydrolase [Bacteroidota bacterium]